MMNGLFAVETYTEEMASNRRPIKALWSGEGAIKEAKKTGRALLDNALKEKGLTEQQIHSKTADVMLEVLAAESGLLDDTVKETLRAYEQRLKNKIAEADKYVSSAKQYYENAAKVKEKIAEYEAQRAKLQEEIRALQECDREISMYETAEARDRARLALFYEEKALRLCDEDTDVATIAYIRHLGHILWDGMQGNVQYHTNNSED